MTTSAVPKRISGIRQGAPDVSSNVPRPTVPAVPLGAHLRTLCLSLLVAALVAQTVVAASPSPDPAARSARVAVEDFAFTPSNITIAVGGSVVWAVRKDPEQHTVTPTEPDSFVGSGQLSDGDDYAVTFDRPGRYDYACSLHPFMTGTVIVQSVETVAPTRSAPPTASGPVRASPLVPAPSSSAGPTVATPANGTSSGAPAALAIALIVAVGVGLVLVVVATHRRRGPSG